MESSDITLTLNYPKDRLSEINANFLFVLPFFKIFLKFDVSDNQYRIGISINKIVPSLKSRSHQFQNKHLINRIIPFR
jgi:hypothetical protein